MKKILFVAILALSLVGGAGQASADQGKRGPTTAAPAGITWERAGITRVGAGLTRSGITWE
ncbi:MAG TPA: hypothetical protein VFC31_00510 [Candidatus Limnocylindria bacterium]|nr:hypothetical protein [Candidatus Limnocylindria bacterium]